MIQNYDPKKTFYENFIKEDPPERVRLIDAKTAAKILDMHPDTVRKWRRAGILSYRQAGKRYFYLLHEVHAVAVFRLQIRMEFLLKKMNHERI